jgi:hypothetical protein
LKADYVISLDIKVNLVAPGSHEFLCSPRAMVSMKVLDTHTPDEDPIYEEEYETGYNDGGTFVDAGPPRPRERRTFLDRVAAELAEQFATRE